MFDTRHWIDAACLWPLRFLAPSPPRYARSTQLAWRRPGLAFYEAFVDHRHRGSVSSVRPMEVIHREPPLHLMLGADSRPADDVRTGPYPSRSPSSRDRATAWLREETPSLR